MPTSKLVSGGVERTFGPLPEFIDFNPADLAQTVSAYRKWIVRAREEQSSPFKSQDQADFGAISEEGVEKLVRYCYSASLLPEEGRYPRFLVFVAGAEPPELVSRFTSSIRLDGPDVLRKLAPVLAAEFALSVREHNGELHCEGIALNQWEKNFILPQTRTRPTIAGMSIRVQAPGEIAITEGLLAYQTRGSKAWPTIGLGFASQAYEWLCELTGWIGKRLNNPEASGFFPAFTEGMASNWLVDAFWMRVLHTAQRLGHGGAFVIRPAGVRDGITIKRETASPHLGEEIVNHLNAAATEHRSLAEGRLSLLSHAESLAHISTVDGCVVLDRTLKLCGFAGHIQVDDSQLRNVSRILADDAREPRSEEALLKGLGSRHNSAFRLCKAYPNHLVFVISQDGDVRLFASNEENVFERRISPTAGNFLSW